MKGPDQCAAPLRLRRIKSLKRKAGFLHKGPNNSSQDIFLALLYISRSYSCFNFPPGGAGGGEEEALSAPTGGQTHWIYCPG